jgi:phosphatidylglycerol:prolipoprotein diacylglycerol transferase
MNLTYSLSWINWDPPREAFTIPFLNVVVVWYGILFATGFILGYYIFVPMLRKTFANNPKIYPPNQINSLASNFADKATWFIVLGTIIGARLGHVFFYDWPMYRDNPLEILMIRNGGLASHGGTIGVMLGLLLFLYWNRKQYPGMTFIRLTDLLVVPTALAVCFIRIANFFNQEIIGYPTDLSWGVIFGHAADGSLPIPRHAVQLYEAIAYFITFVILYGIWKKWGFLLKPGILTGIFFISVFGSRFFIEYLKEPQTEFDSLGLQLGQTLSIPFVLLGIAFFLIPQRNEYLPKKNP